MRAAKKAAITFVAEIDEAELTLRFAEIGCGIKRPPGMGAKEALDYLNAITTDPYAKKVLRDFHKMARTAILYLGDCIQNGSRPS